MSGIRYWSVSAIRVKPSIEEPSNQVPCLTEPSSWWIGIVTALTWPMMSVNWSWTKRIPLAFAASICVDRRRRPRGDHRSCLLLLGRAGSRITVPWTGIRPCAWPMHDLVRRHDSSAAS